MSTTAKATLAASILFCCASVAGVHYIQNEEKAVSTRQLTIESNEKKSLIRRTIEFESWCIA